MLQITALFLGAMIVLPAFAGMDTVVYTLSDIGHSTASTGTATYVARGLIESVYVDVTALTTGTVTITSSSETILSKSITADANFYPRVAGQTTAGAAATWTELGSNLDGQTTNTITTTKFGEKIAVAGDLTCKFVGSTPAITTNDVVVTVILNK